MQWPPELTTTVNEQNEQAVGFYKKVGFKVTDALRWTIWETVSVAESGICGGVGGFLIPVG